MGPIIGGVLSLLSSLFGGFFKTKQQGIDALSKGASDAIDLIKSMEISEAQKEAAIAQVIAADAASESWLNRNWRAVVACTIWGMIFAMFCGYHPTILDVPLTPTMEWVLMMGAGCLFGYMPIRRLDSWIGNILKSKTFTKIIDKVVKEVT